MNQITPVLKAISTYARAYAQLEHLQESMPDWLPVGDQKTGVIGEFYAKIYLQYIRPDAETSFGGTSQRGWDLVVKTESKQIKVQVKTVSEYSKTRKVSPIHSGWDELLLIYLDNELSPAGLWVITDTSIVPPGGTLKNRTMPRPGNPNSGSAVFAARQDRLEELQQAIRQLG